MGINPVTLTLISGGLQIAQGIQGYTQNKAAAKSAAAQTAYNIQNEKNALAINQEKLAQEQRKIASKQRVNAAVSGATLGSFDSLFEDTTNKSLIDQALLEYDSKLNQESLRFGGATNVANYQGAAKSSLLSGVGKAVGSYADYEFAKAAMDKNTSATTASKAAGLSKK